MKKIKIDGMLMATLLTTLFYSLSYPYIHKEIVSNVSNNLIAANQIVNCLSVVVWGEVWKRHGNLFKLYPCLCILETILSITSAVLVITLHNIVAYYIIDTLIFSIVTRNIICGGIKLRAIRYNTENDRERFDNNNNSASSIATIIGSMLAMILNLDFNTMIIIATIGNTVDNIFYIFIYKRSTNGRRDNKIKT